MKKIIIFLCCVFLLVGCNKNKETNIIEQLDKKISTSNNYQIKAILEIFRNEEKFSYDVVSTYAKPDYFKVQLINKTNNHEQIILKNSNSVYVITPSLNKSFKFQSDWPHNGSQIYLLQPIISDIKADENRIFEKTTDGFAITSDVNYISEKNFENQKVYFDKDNTIKMIEIIDKKENVKMKLEILNIQYGVKLEDGYFDSNKYYNSDNITKNESNEEQKEKESSNIEEIVYPMYVPAETYLVSQDMIESDFGERAILTFEGESSFVLIQEKATGTDTEKYFYGDPYLIMDTIGTITDNSVTWISEGVEYSVISDTMAIDELLTVAQSISVEPVGK